MQHGALPPSPLHRGVSMARRNKEHALRVVLPFQELGRSLGGLHQEIASADVGEDKVVVSSGFACGNLDMYVSVNEKRVITVSCEPLVRQAIEKAVALSKGEL